MRHPANRRRSRRQVGITLMETMVVVVIIGILAAIAIPVYRSYVFRSKASEVFTNLQGIRDKQEAYFERFGWYTDDVPFHPYAAGSASTGP